MLTLTRWKVIICLLAVIFGVAFTLPNVIPQKTLDTFPAWVPKQKLNLGLDLQGGSYLLLEVDTNSLKTERLANLLEDVRTSMREAGILYTGLGQVGGDAINVHITDPAQVDKAFQALAKLAQPIANTTTRDINVTTQTGGVIQLALSPQAMQAESAKAVEQSIEKIRRRVDALGTKEPSITSQGVDRIVVEAPGESDPERLKDVIGKTAKLTFQMVDETVTPEDQAAGRIPPDDVLLPSESASEGPVVVKRRALVSGDMLTDASQGFDQQSGEATVNFRFNGIGRQGFGMRIIFQVFDDLPACFTPEHDQVEQGVAAQPVGAMHRHAGAFAHRIQPVYHFIGTGLVGCDDLAVEIGRYAAHHVMRGGHHRDWRLGRVDMREFDRDLAYAGQALAYHVVAEMVQLEHHMIAVRPATPPLVDLYRHRARHHVAAGQVFRVRRVFGHEALAVLVDQIAALASHPFGDQHARAIYTGGMELEELHVLQRNAGTRRHAQSVAGIDEGIGTGMEDTPCTAGGEQCGTRLKDHRFAGFDLHCGHTVHIAIFIADQVQCHPFGEKMRIGFDVLLIQRVQQRVAGTVSRRTSAIHRRLAVLLHMAAERALIYLAAVGAVERHAEMFQLVYDFGRGAAHEFDRVLVTQIIRALHRVIHMPVPVVFLDVAQRSSDAALCRDGMRARREHLGQHRDLQAGMRQLQRRTHPGAARADNYYIECTFSDCH